MKHLENPITDITYVSDINKVKILNLVRNRSPLSRTDIAHELGLSLPTVSRLVDSLIHQEKLVNEIGKGTSNIGRPPTLVEFAGSNHFVIGVSLGNTYITGVLTDLNAQSKAEKRIFTLAHQGFHKVIKRTAHLINDLVDGSGVPLPSILGVGIATGGLIDTQRKLLAYSAAFNWVNKDLAMELNQLIDKPILFDHTARVMAQGELWFGIGDRIKNFIFVLLGYGIGAAFILDGKPYYGTQGMTGEFGHMIVDKDSQIQCACGNYGCLEAVASGHGIAMAAQQELPNHPESRLYALYRDNPSAITAEQVADAAKLGDVFSRKILFQAAQYIGIGLANLINLFNPQAIILGGGMTLAGEILFNEIKQTIQTRALNRISKNVIIQPASLGKESKVMGAVALILNEILNLNITG